MSKRSIIDYFKTSNVPAKVSRGEEPLEVQTSETHSDLDTSNVYSIFDIQLMVGKKFTDAEKLQHLENLWTPGKNSVFPSTQHGKKQLKFRFGWLENWKWLAYSKIEDGAYCKYCVLFSKDRGGKGSQLLGQLCTEAFNK